MLQLSFLLYIFPILILILGAAIGDNWGTSAGIDRSTAAAAFGFFGFFAALGLILLLEKKAKRSDKYKPVITKIKQSGGTPMESCKPCN